MVDSGFGNVTHEAAHFLLLLCVFNSHWLLYSNATIKCKKKLLITLFFYLTKNNTSAGVNFTLLMKPFKVEKRNNINTKKVIISRKNTKCRQEFVRKSLEVDIYNKKLCIVSNSGNSTNCQSWDWVKCKNFCSTFSQFIHCCFCILQFCSLPRIVTHANPAFHPSIMGTLNISFRAHIKLRMLRLSGGR